MIDFFANLDYLELIWRPAKLSLFFILEHKDLVILPVAV